MASLTDLLLGLVALALFRRLPRDADASRYWRAMFAWVGAAGLGGAVHHAVLVGHPAVGRVAWAVLSTMVVVIVSYLLAATVVEVLGRARAVVFWPLRMISLLAYVGLAVTGRAGIGAIVACEGVTMACVLGLWVWAFARHHPAARPMLVAIAASIGAAVFRLVPGISALVGLDSNAAYHLGQTVGMVLLARAVVVSRTAQVAVPRPLPADRRAASDGGAAGNGRAPHTGPPPRR
jgi:hypothetical protein